MTLSLELAHRIPTFCNCHLSHIKQIKNNKTFLMHDIEASLRYAVPNCSARFENSSIFSKSVRSLPLFVSVFLAVFCAPRPRCKLFFK